MNFGFDQADTIIAVGYELHEFDPVRINPSCDTKIIHIHRFPAEVDLHYEVEVGLQSDIGRTRRGRRPEGCVLVATGDGAFMMNSQEIETALRERIPIVVLIWVDDAYGLIKLKMELELGHSVDIAFGNPTSSPMQRASAPADTGSSGPASCCQPFAKLLQTTPCR